MTNKISTAMLLKDPGFKKFFLQISISSRLKIICLLYIYGIKASRTITSTSFFISQISKKIHNKYFLVDTLRINSKKDIPAIVGGKYLLKLFAGKLFRILQTSDIYGNYRISTIYRN